jgi:hypothetical protein
VSIGTLRVTLSFEESISMQGDDPASEWMRQDDASALSAKALRVSVGIPERGPAWAATSSRRRGLRIAKEEHERDSSPRSARPGARGGRRRAGAPASRCR